MNLESIYSALRGNLSCEECSTKFNLLRKKKICCFCKNLFCQPCMVRRDDKKFCCRKCQILTTRPLDRNKLLNLKSRDLIKYLSSNQIPIDGCVEKEDLVNVLIRTVNNSCYHPSSTAHLNSNTCSNSHSSSFNVNTNEAAQMQESQNTNNDGIRIIGHNASSEINCGQPSHYETEVPVCESTNETEQFQNISEMQTDRLSDNNAENNEGVITISQAHSNSNYLKVNAQSKSSISSSKPLKLSDIKSRSDLDALSVKQLKELLLRNRTDFRGCVERDELIQKANRLWSDYTVSRKDLENLSLEELCKVCMDAPIECVLLECGHMATCTSCGKQLCECPICRQFVVRCVRTFKA